MMTAQQLRNRSSAPEKNRIRNSEEGQLQDAASLVRKTPRAPRYRLFSFQNQVNTALLRLDKTNNAPRYLIGALFALIALIGIIDLWDCLFYSYGFNDGTGLAVEEKELQYPSTFAVVINTYKRPGMLRDAVLHYGDTCGRRYGVGQVFIVWAELHVEPPMIDSFFETKASSLRKPFGQGNSVGKTGRSDVAIIRVEKDSLNSRFLPIDGLNGEGVFMVDDDVRVDCRYLYKGFEAWREHPDSMVGYYPRLASPPLFGRTNKGSNILYHTWPVVYLRSRFNMILTKAAFFHSKYLSLYSESPQEIRDYVDENKNCEDIAMAFLVANITGSDGGALSRPIYVQGSVSDKGLFSGISTGTGHYPTRSLCLTGLASIYQEKGWGYPLIDVSLSERSWLRHSPGFWWQARPSNLFEWLALQNPLA